MSINFIQFVTPNGGYVAPSGGNYVSPSGGGIVYPSGGYNNIPSGSAFYPNQGAIYEMHQNSYVFIYPSGSNFIFPSGGGQHFVYPSGGMTYVFPSGGTQWVNPSGSEIKYIFPSGGGYTYVYPSGVSPYPLPSGGIQYVQPSGSYVYVYPFPTPSGYQLIPSGGYVMPSGGSTGGGGGVSPRLFQRILLTEYVEPFYKLCMHERVVRPAEMQLPILERIVAFLTLDAELIDFNNIKLKWNGDFVPEIKLYKKVTIDKDYGEPVAILPFNKLSHNLVIDDQPYSFKIVDADGSGESKELTIGIGKALNLNSRFDLGFYKQSIVVETQFIKRINLEVTF